MSHRVDSNLKESDELLLVKEEVIFVSTKDKSKAINLQTIKHIYPLILIFNTIVKEKSQLYIFFIIPLKKISKI